MRWPRLLLLSLVTVTLVPVVAAVMGPADPDPTPLAGGAPDACAAQDDAAALLPVPPCNRWASQSFTGPANEVHIAINPLDPLHLLAVGKDYGLGSNGDCAFGGALHVASASYVSFDGGVTWSVSRVPAPYPNGGAEPSPLPNKCGSDPVALFGPDGTAYYVLLNFHYTGGRQASIAVARSPDGGLTWPADDIRVLHSSPGDDKEWGTVSPSGRVHVVWTDLATGHILYARSNPDWTFDTPRQIASAGSGNPAVTVAAGPGGEIYVVWRSGSNILIRTSLDDGASFGGVRTALTVQPYEASGTPRLPFMPQVAVADDPDAAHAGRLYVVWPDRRDGGSSAYISWSDDQGQSFAAPVRADNRPLPQHRAVLVTVDVAPDGRVDMAWLDDRDAGSTFGPASFRAYGTSSLDGGTTWLFDRALSDVPLVVDWCRHQNGSTFIGDYMGIASAPDGAYVIFPGNSPQRVADGLPLESFRRCDATVTTMRPLDLPAAAAPPAPFAPPAPSSPSGVPAVPALALTTLPTVPTMHLD